MSIMYRAYSYQSMEIKQLTDQLSWPWWLWNNIVLYVFYKWPRLLQGFRQFNKVSKSITEHLMHANWANVFYESCECHWARFWPGTRPMFFFRELEQYGLFIMQNTRIIMWYACSMCRSIVEVLFWIIKIYCSTQMAKNTHFFSLSEQTSEISQTLFQSWNNILDVKATLKKFRTITSCSLSPHCIITVYPVRGHEWIRFSPVDKARFCCGDLTNPRWTLHWRSAHRIVADRIIRKGRC